MRKINKLFYVTILLLLMLTLSACGKKGSSDKESDKTKTTTWTLQGHDISEYTIVYPDKNETDMLLADWLKSRIAEATKKSLTVISDAKQTKGKQILVGTTNRTEYKFATQKLEENSYFVGADDTYVCVRGADLIDDYYAAYDLITTLLKNAEAKQETKLKASSVKEVPSKTTLTAMSFNIYVGTPEKQRETSVLQTVLNYLPDTLGVQEASPEWMAYLKKHLGDFYAYVGQGRDGGENGEHNAIFYRKDRFELLEDGTKWLSHTPHSVSRLPDAALNRIFTYAILQSKQSGSKVMAVNTHLDHISPEVRSKQADILTDYLEEYTSYPIILTGDFNDTPKSTMYQTMTAKFADSAKIAEKAEESHTFHNYGAAAGLFDFIFVNSDAVEVSNYKVIKDKANGMLPSDHYPVLIEYQVTAKPQAEVPENPNTETPVVSTQTPNTTTPKPNTTTQKPSTNPPASNTNPSMPSTSNEVLASLTAMSFNLYVGNQTSQRQVSVLQTIRKYMPDTLGVQEANAAWMNYLNSNLQDSYNSVGQGRDGGGNGEYSAIFYRKNKFHLVDSGTKWLSDTPDKPSAYPESSLNRIFTYAVLQEKQSNVKILVINTHFDHSGPAARNRQVQVLLNFIRNYSGYPIVFTGDLNDQPTSDMYSTIRTQLADSSRIAKRAQRADTYHNYSPAAVATLDYIFVTQNKIDVSYYKVITDKENGMLPSDHYPVYIEYDLIR